MALVNEHFLKLPNNYLFSDIAKKVNAFKVSHPQKDLIRLGIGDVTMDDAGVPLLTIDARDGSVIQRIQAGWAASMGSKDIK